jgi:hypothetical protein
MARYQLILAYDGTRLAGSQRQASGSSNPVGLSKGISGPKTVQGELENALRMIGWTGRSVLIAGRTDSGVHAEGQSVALCARSVKSPRISTRASMPKPAAIATVSSAIPSATRYANALPGEFGLRWMATPCNRLPLSFSDSTILPPLAHRRGHPVLLCGRSRFQCGTTLMVSGNSKSGPTRSFIGWCAGWSLSRWRLRKED